MIQGIIYTYTIIFCSRDKRHFLLLFRKMQNYGYICLYLKLIKRTLTNSMEQSLLIGAKIITKAMKTADSYQTDQRSTRIFILIRSADVAAFRVISLGKVRLFTST